MKKFTIQAILLILVIGIMLYFFKPGGRSIPFPFLPQAVSPSTLQINGASLKVEIADTPQERSKGLGGREALASGSGMLFVFAKADKYSFWMKGVKFPLDFIYIKEGKVVDIIQNVPPPKEGEKDENLPIYQPKLAVDEVLEVAAGTVKNLDIKEGDTVKLSQ